MLEINQAPGISISFGGPFIFQELKPRASASATAGKPQNGFEFSTPPNQAAHEPFPAQNRLSQTKSTSNRRQSPRKYRSQPGIHVAPSFALASIPRPTSAMAPSDL